MANVARVNGFRPVVTEGAQNQMIVNKYVVAAADATAMYVGDLVALDGTSDATTFLPTITRMAATDTPVIGVVVGFEVASPAAGNLSAGSVALDAPIYRAALTKRVVLVADDPSHIFEAQEDGDTDPLEAADVGLNVQYISTSGGNTLSGASGMQIDSTSHATTNTHILKLLGAVQRPDNEIVTGGQANTRWLVKINNHARTSTTGV